MGAPACPICAELTGATEPPPGGTIFDDGRWVVTHHPKPYADPGELIVKSRRHCESLGELTPDEAAALGPVLRAAVHAIETVVRPERVYAACFGERVRHVHFYLLPRTRAMPAGHVKSDLHRNARMLLRQAGLLPDPGREARGLAAARIREAWGSSDRS